MGSGRGAPFPSPAGVRPATTALAARVVEGSSFSARHQGNDNASLPSDCQLNNSLKVVRSSAVLDKYQAAAAGREGSSGKRAANNYGDLPSPTAIIYRPLGRAGSPRCPNNPRSHSSPMDKLGSPRNQEGTQNLASSPKRFTMGLEVPPDAVSDFWAGKSMSSLTHSPSTLTQVQRMQRNRSENNRPHNSLAERQQQQQQQQHHAPLIEQNYAQRRPREEMGLVARQSPGSPGSGESRKVASPSSFMRDGGERAKIRPRREGVEASDVDRSYRHRFSPREQRSETGPSDEDTSHRRRFSPGAQRAAAKIRPRREGVEASDVDRSHRHRSSPGAQRVETVPSDDDRSHRRKLSPGAQRAAAARLEARKQRIRAATMDNAPVMEGFRGCFRSGKAVGLKVSECMALQSDIYQQECLTSHSHRGDDDLFLNHKEKYDQKWTVVTPTSKDLGFTDWEAAPPNRTALADSDSLVDTEKDSTIYSPPDLKRRIPGPELPGWMDSHDNNINKPDEMIEGQWPPEAGFIFTNGSHARQVNASETTRHKTPGQSKLREVRLSMWDHKSPPSGNQVEPNMVSENRESDREERDSPQHHDRTRDELTVNQGHHVDLLQQELSDAKKGLHEAFKTLHSTRRDSAIRQQAAARSSEKLFRERLQAEEKLRREIKSNEDLTEQIKQLEKETLALRSLLLQPAPPQQEQGPRIDSLGVFSFESLTNTSFTDSDNNDQKIIMVMPNGTNSEFSTKIADSRRRLLKRKEQRLSNLVNKLREREIYEKSSAELIQENPSPTSVVEIEHGSWTSPALDERKTIFEGISNSSTLDGMDLTPAISLATPEAVDKGDLVDTSEERRFSRNFLFRRGSRAGVKDRNKEKEVPLEDQIVSLKAEMVGLRAQLAKEHAARLSAEHEVSCLEERSKKFRDELADLRSIVEVLQAQKKSEDGNALCEEVHVLRSRLEDSEKTSLHRKMEADRLCDEISCMKQQIDDIKSQLQEKETEIEDHGQEKNKLEAVVSMLKAKARWQSRGITPAIQRSERERRLGNARLLVSEEEALSLQSEIKMMREKLSKPAQSFE